MHQISTSLSHHKRALCNQASKSSYHPPIPTPLHPTNTEPPPPTMASAFLNSLAPSALTTAVKQILDNDNFWKVNAHVEVSARRQVTQRILQGNWPDFPVFSPYAKTHDGYSQGKSHPITLQSSTNRYSTYQWNKVPRSPSHFPPQKSWSTGRSA